MDAIDKCVRKELEDLNLNDYSALYREAEKGDTRIRPSYAEIEASSKAAEEAMRARIQAEVKKNMEERERYMKEQEERRKSTEGAQLRARDAM
ncbi:uncharacterized protein TrAtP1_003406 [Trichoderma atroviride]|uniref:uncharacterized protein n=1 Tax=Hypocrea atroviridis TaxID=63577 RepID=UPI003322E938|nr:hypothetical protein TrAtP1_003406 [Trichoderma atroviride]